MNKRVLLPMLIAITVGITAVTALTIMIENSEKEWQNAEQDREVGLMSNHPSATPAAEQDLVLSPEELPGPEPQFGVVTIASTDAVTSEPVQGVEFAIELAETGKLLELIRTDEAGQATSEPIEYGAEVVIRPQTAPLPYAADEPEQKVLIEQDLHEASFVMEHRTYVKGVQVGEDGAMEITHVLIEMDELLQKPELPNGCEITSLTAVLNALGYEVSKTEMADQYLPKEEFEWKDGKLYGANPYKAYAGNPRLDRGGWFVYAPPIVDAADRYIADAGGVHHATDISGSSREEIMAYLMEGVPVVMWVTLNLEKPRLNYSWYYHDTGEFFRAPTNLHAVVLHGFNGDEVYVMDPLRGLITRNADQIFQSYVDLGSHAVVVAEQDRSVQSPFAGG